MTSRVPTRLVALLAVLAFVAEARAETVVLHGGRTVQGLVVHQDEREVLVQTGKKVEKLRRSSVERIDPDSDPAARYAAVWETLPKRVKVPALAAMAIWAADHDLEEWRVRTLERILVLEPDHEAAHRGLGHESVDGRWMTAAEAVQWRLDRETERVEKKRHDAILGVETEVLATPHFLVVDALGDAKVAARTDELEHAWRLVAEALGEPAPWTGRATVVVVPDREQYDRWLDKVGRTIPGMSGNLLEFIRQATGLKWHEPPFLVRHASPDRGAMHAANIHAVGHLLVNLWRHHNRKQPFWIEEGVGGWLEREVLDRNTSFCFNLKTDRYGGSPRGMEGWDEDDPDWKALIQKTARENRFLPLDQLDSLPRGDYTLRECGQSYALVRFLLTQRPPAKFAAYLERVKGGEASPAALKGVYDLTFEQIEDEWKDWIRSW